MPNFTTKDNQLQGNQDQEAQTVYMTSCGRDTGLSENRVAKVTGSRGNNGAGPVLHLQRNQVFSSERAIRLDMK